MSSALDILEDFDDGSGDDAEAMTAADVLQKLEEVMMFSDFQLQSSDVFIISYFFSLLI